ncbi:3-oxoacyl-[acyl-carrier-protein] synthase III C-terminal domain-containing protein [Streptomyces sp. KLMMK]|uniref:3-oxoacyl-[acyl-carrier-protein] synthase III C-terminal domain-containing protein n=1 Tax=Streptomyces sp. KLMMK TaxID=3109353 RepID=UPI002FFE99BE
MAPDPWCCAAESTSEAGTLGPVVLGSDGSGADLIRASRPGALHMDGADVFRHAVDRMSAASRQAATAAGWTLADVDRLVPHQANSRITAFVARQLGIPVDRQLGNVAETGNTGAASIPLLLVYEPVRHARSVRPCTAGPADPVIAPVYCCACPATSRNASGGGCGSSA